MAHYEKFTLGGLGHLLDHDKRINTENRENINCSLSCLNYNLATKDQPVNEYLFIKQKIEQSKASGGRVNARSVVCCSVVISLPDSFPSEYGKEFFNNAYRFYCEQHRKENICSAWVHRDEPNAKDHMHIKFTPCLSEIKKDKNGCEKEVLQFNAKKMISKNYLSKHHQLLNDYMKKAFGFDVGVVNGATTDGNLSIVQLKTIDKKVTQRVEQLEKEVEENIEKVLTVKDELQNNLKDSVSIQSKTTFSGKVQMERQDFQKFDFLVKSNTPKTIKKLESLSTLMQSLVKPFSIINQLMIENREMKKTIQHQKSLLDIAQRIKDRNGQSLLDVLKKVFMQQQKLEPQKENKEIELIADR